MLEQIKFAIQKLYETDSKSLLVIGMRHDSLMDIPNYMKSKGAAFSVLEVWEPNVNDLRQSNFADEVFLGDARKISEVIDKKYDAVFWLHGPEHIHWDEFLECRDDIESIATKLVMYQAPIGHYPQGHLHNNPYEEHVSTLTPDMFEELGYNVQSNLENTFAAYLLK